VTGSDPTIASQNAATIQRWFTLASSAIFSPCTKLGMTVERRSVPKARSKNMPTVSARAPTVFVPKK